MSVLCVVFSCCVCLLPVLCVVCACCVCVPRKASRGRRLRSTPREGPRRAKGGPGGRPPGFVEQVMSVWVWCVVWCGVMCLFVVCCLFCVLCFCCCVCLLPALRACCVLFACCVCVPDSCQHHTPLGFIICSLVLLCVVCWLFALWLCVGLSSCVVCVVCVAYLGGISTFTIPLVLWLTWRKNYSKAIPA